MAYKTMILIPVGCDANPGVVKTAIAEQLPEMNVRLKDTRIVVTANDNWSLILEFREGDCVKEESAEIVEQFGTERANKEQLSESPCRFELSADDDPDMSHFNDYVTVLHALETFEGVGIFDPENCEFI